MTARRGGDADAVDVVVIGAGIIGAAIARELAEQGRSVDVIDPAPGQGASSGNAGLVVPSYAVPMSTPGNLLAGIRALGSGAGPVRLAKTLSPSTIGWLAQFALQCRPGRVRRDTAVLHAQAAESLAMYQDLARDGLALGFHVRGWLWGFESVGSLRGATAVAADLRAAGARCSVVGPQEARAIEPSLGASVVGGIWFPEEAALDPSAASAALLADAKRLGATVTQSEVVGTSALRDGRLTVETHDGTRAARQVVIAAGADSRAVGRLFGERVAIEAGWGWSVTLVDPGSTVHHPLMAVESHVVISPLEGRVRLTGGMQFGRPASDRPAVADVARLRADAERLVPALAGLETLGAWQGARPMTPSGVPIVRRSARRPGLILATGHGPLGVTLAPLTARRVADVVRSQMAAD